MQVVTKLLDGRTDVLSATPTKAKKRGAKVTLKARYTPQLLPGVADARARRSFLLS
jgi:hypothetical protein